MTCNTNFHFFCLLYFFSIITIINSWWEWEHVSISLQVDDAYVAYVSRDRGNTFKNVSSGESWHTIYHFSVADVTPRVVIAFNCTNDVGVSHFIAQINSPFGDEYYTTDPLTDSNFVFYWSQSGLNVSTLTYDSNPDPGVFNEHAVRVEYGSRATFRFDFAKISPGARYALYGFSGKETEVVHPYPLDMCVPVGYNYTDGLEVTYHAFKCKNNGEDLIVYSFGNDSECNNGTMENGTLVDSFSDDDNVTKGEYGHFSCYGQNRYMVTMKFFGDVTCNETGPAIKVYTATDVCYEGEDLNSYVYEKVLCVPGEGETASYLNMNCTELDSIINYYNESCDFFGDELFAGSLNETYVLLYDCEPTEPTAMPTSKPTAMPASIPTAADMANSLQSFIASLVALFVAFAMAN